MIRTCLHIRPSSTSPRRSGAARPAVALLAAVLLTLPLGGAAGGAVPNAPGLSGSASLDGGPTAMPALRGETHAALARAAAASDQPLTPQQIRTAYALPATGAKRQTIAIVSAYNAPAAAADLSAFSKRFHLPACTSASHCFRVLNESGQPKPLPPADPTGGMWVTESALGLEVAHGVCEDCSLILVEASSGSDADFSTAINSAAQAGANVIVTAFTAGESPLGSSFQSDYMHQHAVVVAAAGESPNGGYGYTGAVNFPSSVPGVVAVGGTQLNVSSAGAYRSEQVWSDDVSGCSYLEPAPSWQASDAAAVGCGNLRSVADIAAMASPGVSVRISGIGVAGGPWYQATGTSVAAPIIGGVIALAGSQGFGESQMLYAHAASDPGAFHDVRTGEDEHGCTSAICRGGPGYNGPTGLGTPFGLAAFLPSGGALSARRPAIAVSGAGGALRTDESWRVEVPVTNGNPFAVSGSAALRRTLRVGGALRTVQFAVGKLALAPLRSAAVRIIIEPSERGLLASLHEVTVDAQLRVRGPAGQAVTVTKKLALYAP